MKTLRQVLQNEGMMARAGKAIWNSFFRGEQERSKTFSQPDARPGVVYSDHSGKTKKQLAAYNKKNNPAPKRQMEEGILKAIKDVLITGVPRSRGFDGGPAVQKPKAEKPATVNLNNGKKK